MAPTEYPANLATLLSLVSRLQVEDKIGFKDNFSRL